MVKTAKPPATQSGRIAGSKGPVTGLHHVTLERYGVVEIVGKREGCDLLPTEGDKGHRPMDAGPLCETCSPTFGDIKGQYEEMVAAGYLDDGKEDRGRALAFIEAHLANGGALDDKHVWPR